MPVYMHRCDLLVCDGGCLCVYVLLVYSYLAAIPTMLFYDCSFGVACDRTSMWMTRMWSVVQGAASCSLSPSVVSVQWYRVPRDFKHGDCQKPIRPDDSRHFFWFEARAHAYRRPSVACDFAAFVHCTRL